MHRRRRAQAVATFQAGTREGGSRRRDAASSSTRSGTLREPRRTPKPRGRLSTRSANRHGGLLTSARNGTNVTFGLRSEKPRTTCARPRESRVVAGRAAAPCPDHAVAGIGRSCLSTERARPARLKTTRAEVGVYFIHHMRRRERAVLVGLARFSRQIRPPARFSKKSARPVSRRSSLFPGVTNPGARPAIAPVVSKSFGTSNAKGANRKKAAQVFSFLI